MSEKKDLAALKPGESLWVEQVGGKQAMRCRLTDLGLIAGTKVTCLGKSPAGDPAAYLIRGTVIALRKTDAAAVIGRAEQPE